MAAAAEFRTGHVKSATRRRDKFHDGRLATAIRDSHVDVQRRHGKRARSLDRITSRTGSPAVTSMTAGSNLNLLATTCTSCTGRWAAVAGARNPAAAARAAESHIGRWPMSGDAPGHLRVRTARYGTPPARRAMENCWSVSSTGDEPLLGAGDVVGDVVAIRQVTPEPARSPRPERS